MSTSIAHPAPASRPGSPKAMLNTAAAVVALATAVAGSALVAGIATGSAIERPSQVEAPLQILMPIERAATTQPGTTPVTNSSTEDFTPGGAPTPLRME